MGERIPDGDETEVSPETSKRVFETAVTQEGGPVLPPRQPDPSASRFEPGTVLIDRYRIVRRLGRGGMGEVFLADDLKLDQQVALKFLPAGLETDEERLKLLFDEIKIARQISHPNACRVFDLGEADGVHFLSMEYIDGEDLQSLLKRIGRLPLEKAIELGRQTCEGLAVAHDAGILHRDLKPANLMIDSHGRAKITDFGLAALSENISGAAIRSGTPAYMAPEQLAGTEISVQSDLYALGLLLYELFTGRRAFEASSLSELKALQQRPTKPPSDWVESFDPSVERVILQCLERDPKARPASAQEIAKALAGKAEIEEGTRLRTLLMSRLAGATRLVETLGDRKSAELFAAHDSLVRDLSEKHSGRVLDKSDGFLLMFERPWQAVRFALAYHQALAEQSKARGMELSARVGIHLGEVLLHKSTREEIARGAGQFAVEGLAKPTTSRLRSLARVGQTLLTQAAFDLARRGAVGETESADRLTWLAHGAYEFEDSEGPVEVFEVGLETLAPLTAPEESHVAKRVETENTILGWRPAPGLEVPYRQNWVVKEKLGEGAFGEVWLGAHKKTGEERVYKFCYEAERLRSLQREITVFRLLKEEIGLRDDIARILDWNLDQAPYFVEFVHVEGGNLVDWAEAQGGISQVPMAERLEIVAQVATALAAAHSVGVLHKDIKPANVLISQTADGKPQAKLTDFGIGLVTDTQRLAAKGITVLGLTEMDPGTSTASTAGTHLYMAPELLAGKASTIQVDIYALGVMLYQVAVGDLDRPLAQGWQRHIDDEVLREDIAACVEGSPRRRPGNADVVAERLRTLDQRRAAREAEAEAARAAEKAHRRRKLLSTIAAVSSVFLVVVSFLAIQAMRARADAERRRGQAEQLIDFMLNDLHEGLDKVGRLDLLEGVARTSQEYFDTLTERDESAENLYKRGLTLLNIGNVFLDQGDAEAASATQRSAVKLFEDALKREPTRTDWRRGLGLSQLRLGDVLKKQGDLEEALEAYRRSLEGLEELVDEAPDDTDHRFAAARAQFAIGELEAEMGDDAALESLAQAILQAEKLTQGPGDAVGWRHLDLLLQARLKRAYVLRFRDQRQAAAEAFEQAGQLAQRLAREDPANTTWRRHLAYIHYQIGNLHFLARDFAPAGSSFEAASASYEFLTQTDPTRVFWRARLAESLRMLGRSHFHRGDLEQALALYARALPILEQLADDDPSRVEWLRYLARIHSTIGTTQLALGKTSETLASYQAALVSREKVAAAAGIDPGAQNLVAITLVVIGNVHELRNEDALARERWTRAVELIEPVVASSDVPTYRDTYAQALLRLDRIEEARPIVKGLLEQGWDDTDFLELVRQKRAMP